MTRAKVKWRRLVFSTFYLIFDLVISEIFDLVIPEIFGEYFKYFLRHFENFDEKSQG
jgi:hypothetical protein